MGLKEQDSSVQQGVDIVFVVDDKSSNSLGRTYCLWLLASACGLSTAILAPQGAEVWAPLRGSEFAACIQEFTPADLPRLRALSPGLVYCVKPLPPSLRLARLLARELDAPLALDIDDPDIEAGLSLDNSGKALVKNILRPRDQAEFRWARVNAPQLPTTVSNPALAETYGGVVIPHVREALDATVPPPRDSIVVAFVGTDRPHKGLGDLRSALAVDAGRHFSLVVTAEAPKDAKPWEQWIGQTSLEAGLALVAESDVVVVPTRDTMFSRGQLPAKLIDALMLGKAVVASDLPPANWALQGTGMLYPPGDVEALAAELVKLRDPELRSRLGRQAAAHAEETFTVAANSDRFLNFVRSASSRR